jgi:predicted Holliday junction resolvase-like endonuclease
MESVLVALTVALVLTLLVTYATVRSLSSLIASYRTEVQKLTAALISREHPVQAAVYMTHDPDRSPEEAAKDRAEKRKDSLPAGLNGL